MIEVSMFQILIIFMIILYIIRRPRMGKVSKWVRNYDIAN
jgi:hypothetical protein